MNPSNVAAANNCSWTRRATIVTSAARQRRKKLYFLARKYPKILRNDLIANHSPNLGPDKLFAKLAVTIPDHHSKLRDRTTFACDLDAQAASCKIRKATEEQDLHIFHQAIPLRADWTIIFRPPGFIGAHGVFGYLLNMLWLIQENSLEEDIMADTGRCDAT